VCHLVVVAGTYYFTRVLKGKVVDRKPLGQDLEEAVADFDSEIQLLELEDGC
jgi:hypothetical protein